MVLAAPLLVSWVAYTQTQKPVRPLTTTKVKDNLYMIAGDGGNVAMLVTGEGVVLVDDMFYRNHDDILAQIRSVTPQPLRYSSPALPYLCKVLGFVLGDGNIHFRSRDGNNGHANRITICAWHHLRGLHGGRVRAWGAAPDDVTWELGVRSGRAPLVRLRGDTYV